MKILITGALGNLGSSLLSTLANLKGVTIVAIDDHVGKKIKIMEKYFGQDNINFQNMGSTDITGNFLDNLHSDLVIHLAYKNNVDFKKKTSLNFSHINHQLTRYIADYCCKFEIPLLYPSSTSLYHNLSGEVDEETIISTTLTDYSSLKLLDELYIKSLSGLKYSILRLGSVHGYSNGIKFNTVVNKFCWQYAHEIPLTVWSGSLNVVKPYLSITDFVSAVEFLVSNMNFSGEIYNLVTRSFTTREIIESIEQIGGRKARVNFEERMSFLPNSIYVSTAKIASKGYMFQGSLAEDIKNTLNKLESQQLN